MRLYAFLAICLLAVLAVEAHFHPHHGPHGGHGHHMRPTGRPERPTPDPDMVNKWIENAQNNMRPTGRPQGPGFWWRDFHQKMGQRRPEADQTHLKFVNKMWWKKDDESSSFTPTGRPMAKTDEGRAKWNAWWAKKEEWKKSFDGMKKEKEVQEEEETGFKFGHNKHFSHKFNSKKGEAGRGQRPTGRPQMGHAHAFGKGINQLNSRPTGRPSLLNQNAGKVFFDILREKIAAWKARFSDKDEN